MKLSELMKTDVDNLAKVQHDKLKEFVIDRLQTVLTLVELEQYDKIEDEVFASPAGDAYGLDNHCIDFRWDNWNKDDYPMDILDITEKLNSLKRQ